MTPSRLSIWTQRDGTETCAKTMTDSHLSNAIGWLHQRPATRMVCSGTGPDDFDAGEEPWTKDGWEAGEWIACFKRELKRRGKSYGSNKQSSRVRMRHPDKGGPIALCDDQPSQLTEQEIP